MNLYSQNDSTHQNYFPHHLGDTWIYFVHNGVSDDTLKVTIISDSLDSNKNNYIRYSLSTQKINDPPTNYWNEYYKVDSVGNVFTGNGTTYSRFQYKAGALMGERWATGYDVDTAFVYKDFESSILGVATNVRHIGHKVGTEGYGEGYADRFGIVFRVGSYAIVGELYLVGAKIDGKIYGNITSVNQNNSFPTEFNLYQNYPNPFNPVTIIKFSISGNEYAQLKIFDIMGREVATILSDNLQTGEYEKQWNGEKFASGVYYYRLTVGNSSNTKKLNLVR